MTTIEALKTAAQALAAQISRTSGDGGRRSIEWTGMTLVEGGHLFFELNITGEPDFVWASLTTTETFDSCHVTDHVGRV